MKKCFTHLFFVAVIGSCMVSCNLYTMDLVVKEPFLVRDIWITPNYIERLRGLVYDVESYTFCGLTDRAEIENFLDIGFSADDDNYVIKIIPNVSVNLEKGASQRTKPLFLRRVKSFVENVGVTISFQEDCPKSRFIEYFLIQYKEDQNQWGTYFEGELGKNDQSCDKHIIEVFVLDEKKLLFRKTFEDRVLYYKTYLAAGREFIVLIFDKYIQLYDLRSGKKVTEITSEQEVSFCYIGKNKVYLILSANNKVKVLDLRNKDQVIFSKAFEDKVVLSGVSMFQHVALALLEQENEEAKFISLIDLKKKEKELLSFKLGSGGYYYGFGKGWKEHDFWMMNHEADQIRIYNMKPFKRLLSKNYNTKKSGKKKKIKNFKVEEFGIGNLGREITMQFDDKTQEKHTKYVT